jgi:hypothetical protein
VNHEGCHCGPIGGHRWFCELHPERRYGEMLNDYRWQVYRKDLTDGPYAGQHRWMSYQANVAWGRHPNYIANATFHYTWEEAMTETYAKIACAKNGKVYRRQ